MKAYVVVWDNGNSACGSFGDVYETMEEAQIAADNWVLEMECADDEQQPQDDGYSAWPYAVYVPSHVPCVVCNTPVPFFDVVDDQCRQCAAA